ncbi:hypothetical protein K502DRAFT_368706 [Neoconidiobolus thromboides FSU 785]|nr:hypothetical protein K502DRAFT_368706 [Neoconidiobolus thromboides FSU 785]
MNDNKPNDNTISNTFDTIKDINNDKDTLTSLDSVYQRLQIETKIKLGAENMLQVFDTFQKGDIHSKREIELQLNAANNNIAQLTKEVEYYENLKLPKNESNTSNKLNEKNIDLNSINANNNNNNSNNNNKIYSKDLKEFEGKDISEIIETVIQSINSNEKDGQMKSLLLKKFCLFLYHQSPSISEYECRLFLLLRHSSFSEYRELRALSIRTCRYILNLTKNLKLFFMLHWDFLIVRALTIDTKWDGEREQAILLIHSIIAIEDGINLLPDGIIRSLVAIAEVNGDKHRLVCIELLCELAILKPSTIAKIGAFKIIINALFEINYESCSCIIKLLLALIDKPETRKFIRPGQDFEVIFSVFNDSIDRSGIHREKIKVGSKLVLEFLRSWNGIMYLCIDNKRAMKSIISALTSNSIDTRKTMLDMFYNLFDINLPIWNANLNTLDLDEFHSRQLDKNYDKNLSLIYQHYAILLHVLLEANIIETLTKLIESNNQHVVFYSTILLAEITKLGNKLMSKASKSVEPLPKLFELATLFKSEELRYTALISLNKVDNSNLNYLRNSNLKMNGNNLNQGHKQIEKIKLRVGSQLDENQFRNLILETQVLADKTYTKWNWEIILELLQGPLLNSKKFEEAIKNYKLIKRLISFYCPNSNMFSEVKQNKNAFTYVQVGCELMKVLVSHTDGIKALIESDFLLQIKEALAVLDPVINSSHQNDLFFSKEKMNFSLIPYYFTFIGTLSRYKLGINLLEKYNIFDLFYRVTELRSRDDLVKSIINHLDYSKEGHARLILSKVLTSAYKHIRLFATNFLRVLLRQNIPNFSSWGIYLLITQLYDPSIEVCEMAVSVLDEACMDSENLQTLVRLKPSMSHLEFAGDSLLLRYLSSLDGLNYLSTMDYVDLQMDQWFKERNRRYVTRIELSLSRALENKTNSSRGSYWFDEKHESLIEDPEKLEKLDGFIFPHFYGELTKTFKGCEILLEKGHLKHFSTYLKQHKKEIVDDNIILNLKACLWALGHIGSSEVGITILAQADAIEDIIWMAENCQVYSLKGTAVYVLGLIGSSQLGDEVLQEANWDSIFSKFNPSTLLNFKNEKKWAKVDSWEYTSLVKSYTILYNDKDSIEKEILTTIGNLSNHILVGTASSALMRLKNKYPPYFQRGDIYYEVYEIIQHYHFRLTTRQFLFNLFDLPFNNNLFDTFTIIRKKLQIININGLNNNNNNRIEEMKENYEFEHEREGNEEGIGSREIISESGNKDWDLPMTITPTPNIKILGFY